MHAKWIAEWRGSTGNAQSSIKRLFAKQNDLPANPRVILRRPSVRARGLRVL